MTAMAKIDFLLTEVGPHAIAVPLELVLAVAEAVAVTPLPHAPAFLAGLVFVHDRVLPLIDLAVALGDGPAAAAGGDGTLVIAGVGDDIRALRVDRALAMVAVEPESVAAVEVVDGPDGEPAEALFGAGFEALGRRWRALDYVRFAERCAIEADGPEAGAALLPVEGPDRAATGEVEAVVDLREPYLLVEIGGETYAVATEAVAEILVAAGLRSMPGTPAHVAGLIDRRGVPLVVLDTARLLGRPGAAEAEGGTILVVEPKDGPPYGLGIARVRRIHRIGRESLHAMPEAMAGVTRYTVIDDGDIVGVLSPDALVAPLGDELERITPLPELPPPETAAAKEVAGGRDTGGHRFLSVRIGAGLFGLDLDRVERILAGVSLTPLPGDGNGFHGLADIGETVVPVRDLRRAFAAQPEDHHPPCILVQLEGATAGLAVDQVLRIEDVPAGAIDAVADRAELPVHGVAAADGRLIALLTIDRLLPIPSASPTNNIP